MDCPVREPGAAPAARHVPDEVPDAAHRDDRAVLERHGDRQGCEPVRDPVRMRAQQGEPGGPAGAGRQGDDDGAVARPDAQTHPPGAAAAPPFHAGGPAGEGESSDSGRSIGEDGPSRAPIRQFRCRRAADSARARRRHDPRSDRHSARRSPARVRRCPPRWTLSGLPDTSGCHQARSLPSATRR